MARKQKKIADCDWIVQLSKEIFGWLSIVPSQLEPSQTELRKVPARVRLARGGEWAEWRDETLYMMIDPTVPLIRLIALDSRNWTDYTLEEYEKTYRWFASENYWMQIDHPGRTPDEVFEENELNDQAAMQDAVRAMFDDTKDRE